MKNPFRKGFRNIDVTSKMLTTIDSMSAFQYVQRPSLIHRLNPAVKVSFWVAVVTLTLLTTNLLSSGILAVVCIIYYFLAKLNFKDFMRDTKFIFIAALSILGAYILIEGNFIGLVKGATVSLRTIMIFLPVVVLLRTTTTSQLLYSFRKVLPYRFMFALTVALRFLPYFSKELMNILSIQRMRGVKIRPKTFLTKEGIKCIMIPLTVRGVKTVNELSMSISSRAFGAHKRRTHLSEALGGGEDEKKIATLLLSRKG